MLTEDHTHGDECAAVHCVSADRMHFRKMAVSGAEAGEGAQPGDDTLYEPGAWDGKHCAAEFKQNALADS